MRRIPIVLAAFAVAAIAACETATSPHVAGLGTGTTRASSTALTIAPQTATVIVGGQTQLTTNASLSLENQVQWRSSQPSVAAVSPAGLVTGITPGTAQITARYSFDTNTVATATVSVTGAAGTGTTGSRNP